jgi:glycerophosphoryl diester phosphodiesterase
MTKITAHRGYHKNHPENSIPAFKAAVELGADRIELDVHETSDGIIFVNHDYVIETEAGPALSYNLKYKEIKNRFPTLEEVFIEISTKCEYEIEVKGLTENFIKNILKLIDQYELNNLVEITSSNLAVLHKIRSLNPTITIGQFFSKYEPWMPVELGEDLILNSLKLSRFNVAHCPIGIVRRGLLEKLREEGFRLHAADCNLVEEMEFVCGIGVDQVSTDELGIWLGRFKME